MHSCAVPQLSSFSLGCFTAELYAKAKISPRQGTVLHFHIPQSVPKEAWLRHRKHPQAPLGVVQRGFPPFLGSHSPLLLPPKSNLALTRSLDTAVNAPAASRVGNVSTLEKSQPQSCKGVTFLTDRSSEKRELFFSKPDLFQLCPLIKAGVSPPI